MKKRRGKSREKGAALIITMLALFLFTILGLYMALNATTGLYISDNFESRLQATYAALAGLNHARALFRGLALNDLLRGPDGAFDPSASYVKQAKSFSFRNPLPQERALSLSIEDPSGEVTGIPDDGLVNTGFHNGIKGIELIPMTGIGMDAPDVPNSGLKILSRYFIKVTDNNGEPSEMEGDLNDSPFNDGDGIVIVRSMGIAKTIPGITGSAIRRNSVAVFEARLKRPSTWDLGPALVILGSAVSAAFRGECNIDGGAFPAIGTVDTIPNDAAAPSQIIGAAAEGRGIVTGGGYPDPSVREISGLLNSDPDRSLLLDPRYLWDFVRAQVPAVADAVFNESQNWMAGSAPYLGSFDRSRPPGAAGQDPKVILVDGNLRISGGLSGGGVLLVTGDLSISGPFAYNGLILVIGSGNLTIDGSGEGITGGLLMANLENQGGEIGFGTPGFSISGRSRLTAQSDVVKMAVGLLPAVQISFREITNSDP
jgi:hypothetical protein